MGKTTLKEKIGYGFASLGDAAAYGFIGVFLLFFLTTIAGISPGIAGTIAAVGAAWNAVFNPIMGYCADKVQSRFGKRRFVMFIFSIPLALAMFLLFTNVELPMSIKPVYYGLLVMLYWTSYTGFFVPYLALGAEYTSDYDDRTVLRLFGSFFNMIGTMLSMVMPTMIVAFFQETFGLTAERAWSFTGLLLGVTSTITILITVAASKHKDLPCGKSVEAETRTAEAETQGEALTAKSEKKHSLKATVLDIFKEYWSVAKLEPMKYLIVASLFSLIGYTMIMSDLVYLFTYNKGLSAGEISGCLLIRTLMGVVFIPIVGKIVLAIDKRETLISFYIFGALGMTAVKIFDFGGFAGIFIYVLFVTVCTAIYWQIMPGIFYDVCEYDRIMHGKSRSAVIVSFQGLVEALAVGIGGQILGLILEVAGFDGEAAVQTETAKLWIENSGTVLPVLFLLVAAAALYKYPINKKVYNELLERDKEQSK